tara:strand:+ start:101 stop:397 length:297 start_codon:yes stop_codon:yes gene_type:complete
LFEKVPVTSVCLAPRSVSREKPTFLADLNTRNDFVAMHDQMIVSKPESCTLEAERLFIVTVLEVIVDDDCLSSMLWAKPPPSHAPHCVFVEIETPAWK